MKFHLHYNTCVTISLLLERNVYTSHINMYVHCSPVFRVQVTKNQQNAERLWNPAC